MFSKTLYIDKKSLVTKLFVNLSNNLTQYVLKKKKTKTTLLNIFLFEVNFN